MKILLKTLVFFAIAMNISCEKEMSESYLTIDNFFEKNGVAMQSYVINGSVGGRFTTPQGTIVTIPANAFRDPSGSFVTGNVTVQFKDIYRKSDMLLSNMPTNTIWGAPLKSGGEFFIQCLVGDFTPYLDPGKYISIEQPAALTNGMDTVNRMQPFILFDTSGLSGWALTTADTIRNTASSYIYNLFKFNPPIESGNWLNCDNASFFNAYPQTNLTLHQPDPGTDNGTQVFLIFKNIASTVRVDMDSPGTFLYRYAPQGLECTLVAFEVKNDKLYAAFVPIKITSNLKVNFSLSPTTTDKFKSSLRALD